MKSYTLHTLVFTCLMMISVKSFCDTLTLNQALQDNLITLSISGAERSENTTSYTPSYTGQCIQMEITNLTNKDMKVFLDAGRFLQPEDTTVQRMIITKDQMITLIKKGTKQSKAYAMCSQLKNHAPASTTVFTLGKKAEGKLLELAQLISKNNYQTNAAQSAIWAMTDNDDIYNIYSDNPNETKALRNFVKEAKGIKDDLVEHPNSSFNLNTEANGTFVKYGKGKLTGSFEFKLKEDTPLSLTLYNEQGEVSRKCLENQVFPSGINTLTYEFTYNNIPIGNYRLKMTDKNGTILVDKILTFK